MELQARGIICALSYLHLARSATTEYLHSLSRIIEAFLNTAVVRNCHSDPQDSSKNDKWSDSSSIDHDIVNKMELRFGNECSTKTVRKMEQEKTPKKHILTMNPQVFAYSMQFLSFKEVCRVCALSYSPLF